MTTHPPQYMPRLLRLMCHLHYPHARTQFVTHLVTAVTHLVTCITYLVTAVTHLVILGVVIHRQKSSHYLPLRRIWNAA